ncbi:hypothetical protein [Kutzneria buriramensis]|uniref:Uncharacterized protein n=1 Tax=Kutzneria buriramensis TaxID=1045776 RepID=A0A3E0GW45_9PSEU|nr:hypothetical protein [Kutzneria buriramensis]REH27731.1 hypothetical protein BCF44_12834 [Kutzneria buriramensis]
MGRLAVIGDVGGHAEQLRWALDHLGADDGQLPPDLVVIQVVPFGQIHGHSTLVYFGDQRWRCTGRVHQRTAVDWRARHVRVRVGGRVFIGVDPGHGRTGGVQWEPLPLDGAELLTAAPTGA